MVRGVPVQSYRDTEAGTGAHCGEYRSQNARPELTLLAMPWKDVLKRLSLPRLGVFTQPMIVSTFEDVLEVKGENLWSVLTAKTTTKPL